jgi:A/G-specific adenine glycosylase
VSSELADPLTAWYRENRRNLAFRRTRDPYAILVAEVLLQRTRIVSGLPYYERFMTRFPTVEDLASASEEEVLKAWEGLGFYGRARNLHRAAKAVVRDDDGRIPGTFSELRELAGIGAYTAGAVASIAFGEAVPAIDGNAARVLSRVFRLGGDLSRGEGRRRLVEIASALVPAEDPGTYNQALMELGSTVCRPKAPRCPVCPLRSTCRAFAEGRPESYPAMRRREPTPVARVAFALAESGGRVLLVRRPARGLLAGLWALPGGEVPPSGSEADAIREALRGVGVKARLGGAVGEVRHTFSHRRWAGRVLRVQVSANTRLPGGAMWAGPEERRQLPMVPFHRRFLEQSRL